MIGFLKKAVADSHEAKLTIIQAMQQSVGGHEPARGFKKIHASAITQPDFCPRQVALLDITGAKLKEKYIPTALKTTFDMGNAVSDLVREHWLGKCVIGNWKCVRCNAQRTWNRKPASDCKHGGACLWKYQEVEFVSPISGVSGSIDLLVDLGGQKVFVVEVKILAANDFEKILTPLPEHSLRTSLYMRLVLESESAYASQVNTDKAKVLYVSRGYGKKNQTAGGEILPFKEFMVKRSDNELGPYLEKAQAVKVWRDKKILPKGICQTSFTNTAKACVVCKQCFSGQYPAGEVCASPE